MVVVGQEVDYDVNQEAKFRHNEQYGRHLSVLWINASV